MIFCWFSAFGAVLVFFLCGILFASGFGVSLANVFASFGSVWRLVLELLTAPGGSRFVRCLGRAHGLGLRRRLQVLGLVVRFGRLRLPSYAGQNCGVGVWLYYPPPLGGRQGAGPRQAGCREAADCHRAGGRFIPATCR